MGRVGLPASSQVSLALAAAHPAALPEPPPPRQPSAMPACSLCPSDWLLCEGHQAQGGAERRQGAWGRSPRGCEDLRSAALPESSCCRRPAAGLALPARRCCWLCCGQDLSEPRTGYCAALEALTCLSCRPPPRPTPTPPPTIPPHPTRLQVPLVVLAPQPQPTPEAPFYEERPPWWTPSEVQPPVGIPVPSAPALPPELLKPGAWEGGGGGRGGRRRPGSHWGPRQGGLCWSAGPWCAGWQAGCKV